MRLVPAGEIGLLAAPMSDAEPLYQLDDLRAWSFAGTALAVVGHPVAHSLSPAMHNAALAELARTEPRFASWRYFKFDVPPESLPQALREFHRHRFHGLNLTVPHKSLAVPQLVGSDATVQAAGAANTLRFTSSGWTGANTDGYGLAMALREEFGAELKGSAIILLGAGGAARGAAVECLQAGCASLWIGNRTAATLEALQADLHALPGAGAMRAFDLARPEDAPLPGGALVINATSLGLKPTDAAPVDLARIPRPRAVFDMIYRPARTALLRQAESLGLPAANGLAMLVHQGARSLGLWTGATIPVAAMRAAADAALGAPAA